MENQPQSNLFTSSNALWGLTGHIRKDILETCIENGRYSIYYSTGVRTRISSLYIIESLRESMLERSVNYFVPCGWSLFVKLRRTNLIGVCISPFNKPFLQQTHCMKDFSELWSAMNIIVAQTNENWFLWTEST